MYNMVCCYSKLKEFDSAIICLEELLTSGFKDYDALRGDEDLKDLRSADQRFEEMINRFDSMTTKVMKLFQKEAKPTKPWLI